MIGIFQDCAPLIDIRKSKKGKSLDNVAQLALQEKTFELDKFRSRFIIDKFSRCLVNSVKALMAAMKKKPVGSKENMCSSLKMLPLDTSASEKEAHNIP